ncbi:MAG: hypothetical protein BAJATHORv1_10255 [Candidatus Thorarchaeota archaeon]|nr:MAG: hypothetical protein BAJATHORv1_10255 [Candidatus Thorarchaeota archaeon]
MESKELSLFLQPTSLKTRAEHGSEITRRCTMNQVGRLIAIGLQDKTIRLLDSQEGEEIQRFQDDALCTSLAFSPRGDIVASGSVERVIKFWDIRTGDCIATLEGHSYPILALSFSPDGDRLVSGSGDTTLGIWDVDEQARIRTLKGHDLYVVTCDWDPTGNRIISGGVDAKIGIWNPNSEKPIEMIQYHRTAVKTIRFSRDGSKAASGSSDLSIIVWDATKDKLEEEKTLLGHTDEVRAVSFSSDLKYLASGSNDKDVYVWSLESGTVEGEASLIGEVDELIWYPDSKQFISSDGAGALIRWEVKELEAFLRPFQDLLEEIESDSEGAKREAHVQKFHELRDRYDERTLRDKRVFYIMWQCKNALGLLKGRPRKV